MAELVVYSEASDGEIKSHSSVYNTARSGSSLSSADFQFTVGQYCYAGPKYYCAESFFSFDTSELGAKAVVSSVVLKLYVGSEAAAATWVAEARLFDFGDTLTTADWVPCANLGNYTLLGTQEITSSPSNWKTFTSEAAFINNINKTGKTRIIVASNRSRLGNAPTVGTYEYVAGETQNSLHKPTLIINYEYLLSKPFIPEERGYPLFKNQRSYPMEM